MIGPHIGFAGCALTERSSMEVFSLLPLTFHKTNDEAFEDLARHLAALEKALGALNRHYDEVDARHPTSARSVASRSAGTSTRVLRSAAKLCNSSEISRMFPYPTTFQGQSPSFVYDAQMEQRHLFFSGRMEGDRRICIKFIRRYGDNVHAWCANEGFAPKLIGFRSLPGGWRMVVMDLLDESWKPLVFVSKPERSESLKRKLAAAIERMHTMNMVHGDLRDTNIMVKREGQEFLFMLVDFDWAGIGGQVKYPRLINRMDISRPKGASDGLAILPEHDIAMLNQMFL
jgi:hypothetical protein